MGSHKTKNQLEIELNELKQLYGEKCSECDFLTKDNRAKSEAAANACADLKNAKKDLEDARAELQIKEACNKKLADQFYDYRTELVKVRKELADAIEKRDSFKAELEGVRGALKRESEMRVKAEKDRDECRKEATKWQNEYDKVHKWYEDLKKLYDKVRKERDEGCAMWREDSWKNREERDCYKKKVEDLEHLADDLEKQRRELEQKLAQERNVSMVQEARATDLEGQLRRKTEFCSDWMNRAFRDEEELKKVKEHDRIAQENFEKAARKNDELQNRVNMLQQRWTDGFNPEDELLGRKVLEWREINVVLAKHNIENSMVLGSELDTLKEYRKVLGKYGVMGPPYLDKRLSQSCPEEYMKVFSKYGIDSSEKLDATLEKWFKVRSCSIILRNNMPYLGSITDLIKELA